MEDQKPRGPGDTHDRLLRLEIETTSKFRAIERQLNECSTGMKWVVGLIGTALVGLVVTLLTRIV